MKKKIISVIILSMLTASMAGCGGDDDSSSSSSTSSSDSSTTSSSVSSSTSSISNETENDETSNSETDNNETDSNKTASKAITKEVVNQHKVTNPVYFIADDCTEYPEYKGVTLIEYRGNDEVVVIPEEINGKKVVGIAGSTFYGKNKIKAIKFPKSIKFLVTHCCSDMKNLETVIFEDGVEIIGESAFQLDKSLASINLPEGLKKLGIDAFSGCTSLKEVKFPESLNVPYLCCFRDMSKDFTLVGKAGIGLEKYAEECNIKFKVAE